MGCGCGKGFSQPYATGARRNFGSSHVPSTRQPAPVTHIQSKSLQAKSNGTVQTSAATSGRRKV